MPVTHEMLADGTLEVQAEFPNETPDKLFLYWIEPDFLRIWWPPEAEVDPRVGGRYILRWPSMNWTLRGEITHIEPGRTLAFTWRWDHEPDTPDTQVHIEFAPMPDGGSRINLTHGPYPDSPQGEEMRTGHIEGWTHFLSQLQAAR